MLKKLIYIHMGGDYNLSVPTNHKTVMSPKYRFIDDSA